MAIIYNAEEIYQMGIEIEKNGLAFYAAAAKSVKNADVKKLCEELGQWEGKHVVLFEALKAKLPEAAIIPMASRSEQTLKMSARRHHTIPTMNLECT